MLQRSYQEEAGINLIRGYGSQEQIAQFNKLTARGQASAGLIIEQEITENRAAREQSLEDIEKIGTLRAQQSLGKVGGTLFSLLASITGVKENDKIYQTKRYYAENVEGYTRNKDANGNVTYTAENGKVLTKEEFDKHLETLDENITKEAYLNSVGNFQDQYKELKKFR